MDRRASYLLLGPLEVDDGTGGRVKIDSPARRRLLAVLAIDAGRSVSRDRLAEVLWPDRLPADPDAALQTHVYRLRRDLADGGGNDGSVIETTPTGYTLLASPDDVDVLRFERLIAEARAPAGSDPERALALLVEALVLWRGPPLAEFLDHDFARFESSRLVELRRSAHEDRGELLLKLDRAGEAVADLEQVFAETPGRERVCSLLMTALYRSGRQADALARFQTHRRFVGDELGLEPSPTMCDLERAVLQHALDGSEFASVSARPAEHRFDARIAYATVADGRSLAWASAGEGPPLVVVPAWVSNIDDIAAGDDPRSGLVATLARGHRVILYDRFGTGLSRGAAVTDASVRGGARELVQVLDHLGFGPVPLLAASQAGPLAVAAAAERPDLVSHLVLLGTYANGPAAFTDRDVTEAMLGLVRAHWGIASKALADMFLPGAATVALERLAAVQRRAADAGTAAELLRAVYTTDVTDALEAIDVPAIVLHYTEDRAIPFLGAQQLAVGLRSAELVALPGRHHLPSSQDVARVAAIIDEFLGRPAT